MLYGVASHRRSTAGVHPQRASHLHCIYRAVQEGGWSLGEMAGSLKYAFMQCMYFKYRSRVIFFFSRCRSIDDNGTQIIIY